MAFDDGQSVINVCLINEATTPLGVNINDLAAALQVQVDRDFCPAWGIGKVTVSVSSSTSAPPGSWVLVLLDTADQQGAEGYHEYTDDDMPTGKVFVKTTQEAGDVVSVTVSHELLEMLADPGINLCYQGEQQTPTFYAGEVCDAVEEQSYIINGVPVSDFVYPAWFEGFRTQGSTKFSFMGSVTSPFALAHGGYISIFQHGKWSQIWGSTHARARFNPKKKNRLHRRKSA